jgi:phage terminase large subunit GpA-like protein
VYLPKVDAELVQQLCVEQLVTRRDRNGFPVRGWQKMRERNEVLDCCVYARTAACAAQMFLDTGDGIVFRGEFGP